MWFNLAGCAKWPDIDFVYEINGFRVLAIKAEPPEIASGQSAELTLLWAHPDLQAGEFPANVTVAWVVCDGYMDAAKGLFECDILTPPKIRPLDQDGDRFRTPILEAPQEAQPRVVTVVAVVCHRGTLPDEEHFEHAMRKRRSNALCKNGKGFSGFKTVSVTDKDDHRQQNPAISRVMINDKTVDISKPVAASVSCEFEKECMAELTMALNAMPRSVQSYPVIEYGDVTSRKEELIVSWFAEGDGELEHRVGSDQPLGPFETWWLVFKPGKFRVYAVLRDSRGGMDWTSFVVEVKPKK
jgi:hypothetical protein